jgi:hypothetical protein
MGDDLQTKRMRRDMYTLVDQLNKLIAMGGTKSAALIKVSVIETPVLRLHVEHKLPSFPGHVLDLTLLEASVFASAFGLGHIAGQNTERLNANGVPHE